MEAISPKITLSLLIEFDTRTSPIASRSSSISYRKTQTKSICPNLSFRKSNLRRVFRRYSCKMLRRDPILITSNSTSLRHKFYNLIWHFQLPNCRSWNSSIKNSNLISLPRTSGPTPTTGSESILECLATSSEHHKRWLPRARFPLKEVMAG